jgi:hypothetical protein
MTVEVVKVLQGERWRRWRHHEGRQEQLERQVVLMVLQGGAWGRRRGQKEELEHVVVQWELPEEVLEQTEVQTDQWGWRRSGMMLKVQEGRWRSRGQGPDSTGDSKR